MYRPDKLPKFYMVLKRIADIFISLVLIILLSIPMIAVALIICITSKGGAIFTQKRIGKNGEPFLCLKFRTMYKDAPSYKTTAEFFDVEKYITPVGRFLRRTSIDELPQLFCVLMGKMSLVGPRPLIEKEREVHRMRKELGAYSILPGMTGLAQIMGRDTLDDNTKAELDALYAKNISLLLDIKILLKTFSRVILAKDIRSSAEVEGRRKERNDNTHYLT